MNLWITLAIALAFLGCESEITSGIFSRDENKRSAEVPRPADEQVEDELPVEEPKVKPTPPAIPSGLSFSEETIDLNRLEALPKALEVKGQCESCTYSIEPALPTGLSLDATTGVVSGIPHALATEKTYVVNVANASGDLNVSFKLAVGTERLAGAFTAVGNLPSMSGDGAVYVIGDTIYKFGGSVNNTNACTTTNSRHIQSAPVSDPTNWSDHGAKLPEGFAYGGVDLRIGDDIYLFSSICAAKILKAPISDLIDGWVDTGATLGATNIYFTQIDQVGDKLYIFGAGAGGDEIWMADVSDPLAWADSTKKIPESVQYLNYFRHGGDLYIIGENKIYKAKATDPTSWQTGAAVAGIPGAGTYLAIGDTAYILSGHFTDNTFSAKLDAMDIWTDHGLYFAAPGNWGINNAAVVGDKLYVFGGLSNTPDTYRGTTQIWATDINRVYSD